MATATPIRAKVTWEDVDRAWPNTDKIGCLSTGLPFDMEWYNQTFLLPHEPIRFNMLMMERAVQPAYFQPTRAWKVHRFFEWYNRVFDHPVHHHHDTEETIVFPFLHNNPNIKLPARLEDDHAVLLNNMNAVKVLEPQFLAALAANDAAKLSQLATELRTSVTELCSQMHDHLAVEEEVIAGLLKQHITEQQMDACIEKIIKSAGSHVFVLGCETSRGQYRAGGEAARQKFVKKMPPPLIWHHNKFAHSWVDGENMSHIHSLCFDTDLPPLLPKRKGFWIFRRYSDEEIQQFYNMPFKRATGA